MSTTQTPPSSAPCHACRPVRRGLSTPATIALVVAGLALAGIGFAVGRGSAARPTVDEFVADAAPDADPASVKPVGAKTPETRGATDASAQRTAPADPAPSRPPQGHIHRDLAADPVDAPDTPAPFEFDPPVLDFGLQPLDTEMAGVIKVKNISAEPLTILAMRPDCKCTTVQDYSGQTIPPGEFIQIDAVVDGRPTAGTKRSEIKFVFDGYGPASVHITSTVSRAVRAEPAYIIPDPDEAVFAGFVTVESLDETPFRIVSVNGDEPVYGDDFDPAGDEPRSRYLLGWDLSKYDPQRCVDENGNRMPRWWVVETDHPDAPLVDVQVRHVPCSLPEPPQGRKWLLSKQRVVLDEIGYDQSAEFTVELKWFKTRPNDTIRQVTSESDLFDAELVEAKRDGDEITVRVRVTPKPGVRGLVLGTARLHGYVAGHSAPIIVIARVTG